MASVYDNRTKFLHALRTTPEQGKRISGVNFRFTDGTSCNDLADKLKSHQDGYQERLAEWVKTCKEAQCCCLIGLAYQVLDIDPSPGSVVNLELAEALGCYSANDKYLDSDDPQPELTDKQVQDGTALAVAWHHNDAKGTKTRFCYTWAELADKLEAAWVEGLEDVRP